MNKKDKIYVAGHRGLVGSAILRFLEKSGYENIIVRTHQELDLLDQKKVDDFFNKEKVDFVFDAAAKVGGIMANKTYPADFIYQNLVIQNNVINAAYQHKVKKLLFLGSSCIYPKLAPQPIKEESFLTGPLEETNQAYAIAKIAGIVMCQSYNLQHGTNFISAMPTNLYGPNDNFDPETSHVLPAFIRKFHDAKVKNLPNIVLWGSGNVFRELMHVDDLARVSVHLMNNYNSSEIINVGTGEDISIKELANIVKTIVGFSGEIVWDQTKPDGTPRKVLDVSKLRKLDIEAEIPLQAGIKSTYEWFLEHEK